MISTHPRARRAVSQRARTGQLTLACAVAACFSLPVAAADDGYADDTWARRIDVANPYASIGYGYDSNLFRVVDDTPVIEGRSDQFATLSAGFDANVESGLQRYELNGVVTHTMFDTYDEVDYTGGRAAAVWHWNNGESTTGTLGYRHRRSLRDFSNQTRFDKIIDIRSENQVLGSADFDLAGNWRLGVRGDYADISFSTTEALDLARTTVGTALSYVSRAGNVVGMDAKLIQGDYDNNPGSDYDEYTVGPTLEWQLTARTKLMGNIGYTARSFSEAGRKDYEDVTGRIAVRMSDNGRSKLLTTIWRDLSSLSDEVAEFAVVSGISVEPSWQFPNGVDLRLFAAYENRDFDASLPGGKRDDDVVTGGVFADWGMSRNFKLSVGFDMQQRSSSRELQDFDFAKVVVQVIGSL